ncbi:PD-(D/E)XK nuclease family protein [Campylobacter sp. RM16190]|uniref:PDDEXK-like family protein n=1 Tax=Campylobacter sp. RM16190 TaxID=1705727 RepID=UPI001473682C|nr:PD-(D/E)XK nuclease family protein [Campylobacter sp. RM16190]
MQEFLDEFSKALNNYKNYIKLRKKRGLHDYNIFTALLKENDEVRLHSRFLYSLLNTEGRHCQDDLFLQLFLKNIGEQDWINTKEAKVFKEYQNIDIYITNGAKHIILENKIYANDQKEQIGRYIDLLREQYKYDSNKQEKQEPEILVVFLSPFGRSVSEYSLGKYELKNGELTCRNFSVRYKEISYQSDILRWLNECEKEVENLTDLAVFIKHYRQVILSITNQKQGEKMDELAKIMAQNYNIIIDTMSQARKIVIDDFVKKLKDSLKIPDWSIETYEAQTDSGDELLLKAFKKESCFYFALKIYKDNNGLNLKRAYFSLRTDDGNINCKNLVSEKSDIDTFVWEYKYGNDFAEYIKTLENDCVVQVANDIIEFIKSYEEKIVKKVLQN